MNRSNVELSLAVLPDKNIPESWLYSESVEKVKSLITSFKTVSTEMLHELWIAREQLSKQGERTDLVANATKFTWSHYCMDVGIDRSTAHRWLSQYDPVEKKKLPPQEPPQKEEIKKAQEAVKKRIDEKTDFVDIEPDLDPDIDPDHEADEADSEQARIDIIKELLEEEPTFELSNGEEARNQDELIAIVKKYLATMESDSRRLEAIHNLIKWLRVKATDYHVVSGE